MGQQSPIRPNAWQLGLAEQEVPPLLLLLLLVLLLDDFVEEDGLGFGTIRALLSLEVRLLLVGVGSISSSSFLFADDDDEECFVTGGDVLTTTGWLFE